MRTLYCLLFLLSLLPLSGQTADAQAAVPAARSFNEIFPELPEATREAVFSNEGFYRANEGASSVTLIGSGDSGIDPDIIDAVILKKPNFLIESIMVIPGSTDHPSLLDVYNALGKTRELKGRLYQSHSRNEQVPLFEEVTRIESAKKTNPIPDPPPASKIPSAETIYMRLKDVNFGMSYYRGDLTLTQRGLHYSLTNNKTVSYFFIPVIKEEKFVAQMYFEPIAEGILIYGLAGAEVSDFVSSKIHMPSAISKRLAVIIGWVSEGIRKTAPR